MHEDDGAAAHKLLPGTDAPVNEKGDEPLSNHNEEIEAAAHGDKAVVDGLSLPAKIGALAVIIAICAVFIKTRSKDSHAYEKVAA